MSLKSFYLRSENFCISLVDPVTLYSSATVRQTLQFELQDFTVSETQCVCVCYSTNESVLQQVLPLCVCECRADVVSGQTSFVMLIY